jgi:hypothetical protein
MRPTSHIDRDAQWRASGCAVEKITNTRGITQAPFVRLSEGNILESHDNLFACFANMHDAKAVVGRFP